MASNQAQIAGPPTDLSLRLNIRHFVIGSERVTARTVALKLHLLHLPGSPAVVPNTYADP
jgi:hypothetical protein